MQVWLLLSLAIVALLAWSGIPLARNYIEARKIGLPVLITPISFLNPFWYFGYQRLGPGLKALPFGIGSFVDYTGLSSLFPNRGRLHARLGPAFVIATPSEVQIIIADPDTTHDILAKRKDFPKDFEAIRPFLDIFGPNLVTAGNDTWSRHRRLTTPPFNESNSGFVWREALAQSTGMLHMWMTKGRERVGEALEVDIGTLTLHVFIAVGLGKSYPYHQGGTRDLKGSNKISYLEALQLILHHLPVAVLSSTIAFPTMLLPAQIRKIKTSVREFRDYMSEMMGEERLAVKKFESEKNNLMTVLLRASESEVKNENGRNVLSDEEIRGNLFMYNFVGHDSIANTFVYCLILLCVEPEIQEWIRQEIRVVFGDSDVKDWEYEKAYPRLKRCLALMNETLRLFGPVTAHPRTTGDSVQTVHIQGKRYNLPAKTTVMLNTVAIHSLPQYWGSDALVWRPNRWITNGRESKNLDNEQFYQPPDGLYTPFATGPRVCPAKKFAQVEWVVVIAQLFRRHQCAVVLLPGETKAEARTRIIAAVKDSNVTNTLKMLHPEKVKMTWSEIA